MPPRTSDGGTTGSRACAISTPIPLPLVERRPAGQQVVGHGPQRVDVAPLVQLPAARRLLGRHEQRRAEDLALAAQVGRAGRRRGPDQAEVEQLGHVVHPPAPRGEDVRRLDVAVDQARRVRLAQRPADLPQQVDRPRRRQGAVALDQLRQAQARQVLHDVVVGPVLGPAVVVDLDGVRVGERGGDLDLALEPLEGVRVGHGARPDQLHGAGALQELVLGQVDLAHPAGADPPPEAILAELPGLGDLPAQPRDRAGPEGGADGQDEQDHRVEAEQREPGGRRSSSTPPPATPSPRGAAGQRTSKVAKGSSASGPTTSAARRQLFGT